MKLTASLLSLFVSGAAATGLSCKNDSGADVDFAYAFKYPKGFNYAYMDSSTALRKSSHTMDSAESSVSTTIMQMHNSGISHIIFNDEPVGKAKSGAPNAHSKGLLLWNEAGGVWLTHSLPKFPDASATSASGLYKEAASGYGQSFLCITLTASEIHKLAPVFAITRPTIYSSKFASKESEFQDLDDLTKHKWNKADMTKTVSIRSKGGESFTFYGKAGAWGVGKDLYRDLVAPAVGSLKMEGWRHGVGVWDAACGKDEVLDVTAVSFPGQDWSTMSDHSKWAVSESGSTFCVGDLNRADGQDKRGGATVCIESSKLAGEMRKVIQTTDSCRSDVMV